MTTVTIVHTSMGQEDIYWAIAPDARLQATGRTPGAALDALTSRLGNAITGTLVIRHQEPDSYFTESQIERLRELVDRARTPAGLTADEEAERDALIDAELLASARRTATIADALGR